MQKMKAERGSHFLILEKSVSVTRRITCHILAMVQFKQSFIYNGAHPKTSSWKPEGENSSCCLSEDVECDEETGHIIGLHLSSSCLYGSVNSSNRLFRLVHLQKLDLSDNYFNYSQIPTAIRNFTRLRYLNLSASASAFFGAS
ncbi:putative leucine-rich repeat domain, L domain-containing protein [Rosa chinensis]|uniref:Putative leucine-rich repeat domain, L domain-containing protein n=1 Tax=Rosa chinensis TaxID=74649 RepID=A0A2P6SFC1_ROSCH|nr:putative leucine-rich repeat domain, L domain-containing protein [Rosa chinensis]